MTWSFSSPRPPTEPRATLYDDSKTPLWTMTEHMGWSTSYYPDLPCWSDQIPKPRFSCMVCKHEIRVCRGDMKNEVSGSFMHEIRGNPEAPHPGNLEFRVTSKIAYASKKRLDRLSKATTT